ncbi:tail tube monomer [Erwinia phage vB_EamM-Bue1]|uniref:Tail tube monomer n=2 Tax=Nezavisimistyvirus TaxID=2841279 RepID=A0A0A0YSX4_9CAUD|nr:tail tube monomer [Erwinia phage phiEa2809]YP_009837735.1 tail tube monomer [Erwinia phage vB_EamM-Bue1]AIX13120.1 tail tube monomer [Erwinia phage phiEa2809]AVO22973.1 tail tube monomer [Erwinia phage vB_EamM-Bue1]
MATVSQFRAAIQNGGGVQRQHRWRVSLNFPTFVTDATTTQRVSLLAVTTNTPTGQLGEILVPWGGREIPMPGDRRFEALPITFINCVDNAPYNAFEVWQQYINGNENNRASADADEYFRDVVLELLDSQDRVTKTFTLQGAWPMNLGQLELDMSAMDSYTQFTVDLRYLQSTSDRTL